MAVIKPRKIMDSFKAYIPFLDEQGINEINLQQIINEHAKLAEQIRKSQARYDTDEVPILKRPIKEITFDSKRIRRIDEMVNNKLNNSFDSYLVDQKIGYVLGHAINYVVDKELPSHKGLTEAVENLNVRENMPDKDSTLGIDTSIAGYGARLVYWSEENGKPILRVTNVDPAECIFLYHETMAEPSYAIQYFSSTEIKADGTREQVQVAEFHDEVSTYIFKTDSNGYELHDIIPHYLNGCPLYGCENDNQLHSDAHKILNLVDAYDRTTSDANSEIEATRLAILILRNIGMDEEDIAEMNEAGMLEMWGQDVEAKYLTKDVNDAMIEHHLDRLEKNITKFAKSVDFSDEAFAGNISGIAMKFKTLALEWKAVRFEHKYKSMLTYQYKLLCAGWALLNICSPEDYLKIWYAFRRNMPANTKEEAETTEKLQGRVSERTRLSLLSFVDDVDAEIEAMKKDRQEFNRELEPLDDDL